MPSPRVYMPGANQEVAKKKSESSWRFWKSKGPRALDSEKETPEVGADIDHFLNGWRTPDNPPPSYEYATHRPPSPGSILIDSTWEDRNRAIERPRDNAHNLMYTHLTVPPCVPNDRKHWRLDDRISACKDGPFDLTVNQQMSSSAQSYQNLKDENSSSPHHLGSHPQHLSAAPPMGTLRFQQLVQPLIHKALEHPHSPSTEGFRPNTSGKHSGNGLFQ